MLGTAFIGNSAHGSRQCKTSDIDMWMLGSVYVVFSRYSLLRFRACRKNKIRNQLMLCCWNAMPTSPILMCITFFFLLWTAQKYPHLIITLALYLNKYSIITAVCVRNKGKNGSAHCIPSWTFEHAWYCFIAVSLLHSFCILLSFGHQSCASILIQVCFCCEW